MKNVTILICLTVILSFLSCQRDCIKDDGTNITTTLSVPDFTGIDNNVSADITITQGAVQEVVVIGSSNIIEKLKTNVTGGVWDIDFERGCYRDYNLVINITVPDVNTIQISGSGDIVLNDFVNQSDLSLRISGSGHIDLNAFDGAEDLSVGISGSGKVVCNADFIDLDNLDLKISGSGTYQGFPATTSACSANISGSGRVYVHANDILDVSISGSGDVHYKGYPSISQNVSGSGRLIDDN